MSLDDCIEYLGADELLEVTPQSLRIRKRILNTEDRRRLARREDKDSRGIGSEESIMTETTPRSILAGPRPDSWPRWRPAAVQRLSPRRARHAPARPMRHAGPAPARHLATPEKINVEVGPNDPQIFMLEPQDGSSHGQPVLSAHRRVQFPDPNQQR